MEVQVKVVRANVWLSARYVDQQDGFLAVARLNGQERVSHATMEPQPSSARAKKYSSVAVKWEEDATLVPFQLQLQSHQEPQLDEQADEQHAAPVRIDISVFLCRKPCRETRKPNTFVFVGHGALTLRQADVDAALSSRQVLFVISLVDGIGDVQVKLQVLTPQDKQRQAQSSPDQGGGGFAIHWSSMAALQQDLEDKARRKAEGEQKLLLRLRKHEDRVLELKRLRAQVLDAMHVHRAARRIQAMFRTNLERQRYERDRHRRAEEARRQAKKAAARQRVLERNQLRSQLMLDRLRQYTNETRSPQAKSKVDTTRSTKPAPMSGQGGNLRLVEGELEAIRAKQQYRETLQLHTGVARLQAQQHKQRTDNQTHHHVHHPVATTSPKHIRPSSGRPQEQIQGRAGNELLDDDLVRAIRFLHFR